MVGLERGVISLASEAAKVITILPEADIASQFQGVLCAEPNLSKAPMSDLPEQRTTLNMQFQSALGHPWWFSFYCEGESVCRLPGVSA